jgi:hypothetical protein
MARSECQWHGKKCSPGQRGARGEGRLINLNTVQRLPRCGIDQAAEIHRGGCNCAFCYTLPPNVDINMLLYQNSSVLSVQGSYHVGYTASRPISEVKNRWANNHNKIIHQIQNK